MRKKKKRKKKKKKKRKGRKEKKRKRKSDLENNDRAITTFSARSGDDRGVYLVT